MTDGSAPRALARLQRILHRLEDCIIAGMLVATLGLALYQIVLRNAMGSGLVWGDILVRLMVLWLGMAGSMVATRERKHISVDLVTRYLSPGGRRAAEALTTFFAGSVCLVACYYSLQFVLSEYDFGSLAFGQVPYWVCVAILPLAFLVIAGRYFLQFIATVLRLPKASA
jgi:TRAP-type C4-dicarboxylate transport system permease small subunit